MRSKFFSGGAASLTGVGVMLLASAAAAQVRYTVTDLGTLVNTPRASSQAWALAERTSGPVLPQVVVGGSASASTTLSVRGLRPFVWTAAQGMYDGVAGLPGAGTARDINADDFYVGTFTSAVFGGQRAFLAGTAMAVVRPLPPLGGRFSSGFGLNATREVVGSAERADGAVHAAMWAMNAAAPLDLGTLGGRTSEAYAISDSGFIVGRADNAEGISRAFIYNLRGMGPLGMRELGTVLPDARAVARDLNTGLTVVGQSEVRTSSNLIARHATLWGGVLPVIIDMGVLRSTDPASEALGLNDGGQAVGWSGFSPYATPATRGPAHAFIWRSGQLIDLNAEIPATAGWELIAASDINNSGHIVGWGAHRDSTSNVMALRAFLLTPVGP